MGWFSDRTENGGGERWEKRDGSGDDRASFSIGIITVVICGAIREAHPKCVPEKRELEINRRRLAREAEEGGRGHKFWASSSGIRGNFSLLSRNPESFATVTNRTCFYRGWSTTSIKLVFHLQNFNVSESLDSLSQKSI